MNAGSPRIGYYVCTLSSLSGAALLFLVGWGRRNPCITPIPGISPTCPCSLAATASGVRTYPRISKTQSLHIPLSRPESVIQQHHDPDNDVHIEQQNESQHHHCPQKQPSTIHQQQPQCRFMDQLNRTCGCCTFHHHSFRHSPYNYYPETTLRPSKSVPEGLSNDYLSPQQRNCQYHPNQCYQHHYHQQHLNQQQLLQRPTTPKPPRDVTVIEQITTCV